MDVVKSITAIITLVVLVFSGFFFFEGRYTQKTSFFSLEKRVSLNELQRQLRQAEDDAAYYRQLLRKYPDDESIKEKLRRAEKRIEKLQQEIDKLSSN